MDFVVGGVWLGARALLLGLALRDGGAWWTRFHRSSRGVSREYGEARDAVCRAAGRSLILAGGALIAVTVVALLAGANDAMGAAIVALAVTFTATGLTFWTFDAYRRYLRPLAAWPTDREVPSPDYEAWPDVANEPVAARLDSSLEPWATLLAPADGGGDPAEWNDTPARPSSETVGEQEADRRPGIKITDPSPAETAAVAGEPMTSVLVSPDQEPSPMAVADEHSTHEAPSPPEPLPAPIVSVESEPPAQAEPARERSPLEADASTDQTGPLSPAVFPGPGPATGDAERGGKAHPPGAQPDVEHDEDQALDRADVTSPIAGIEDEFAATVNGHDAAPTNTRLSHRAFGSPAPRRTGSE